MPPKPNKLKQSKGEQAMQAQLEQAGLWEGCEPEHRFAPPRLWRFDFAWPNLKLALEVEGGHWSGGRHVRGKGFEGDMEKYNEAALAGWLVIRVSTKQVTKSEEALNLVRRAIHRQELKFRVRNLASLTPF